MIDPSPFFCKNWSRNNHTNKSQSNYNHALFPCFNVRKLVNVASCSKTFMAKKLIYYENI